MYSATLLSKMINGNIEDAQVEDLVDRVEAWKSTAEMWYQRMDTLLNLNFRDADLPNVAALGGTFAKLEEALQVFDWVNEDASNMRDLLSEFEDHTDEFLSHKDTFLDEDEDEDDRYEAKDTMSSAAEGIYRVKDELLKSYKLDLEADA